MRCRRCAGCGARYQDVGGEAHHPSSHSAIGMPFKGSQLQTARPTGCCTLCVAGCGLLQRYSRPGCTNSPRSLLSPSCCRTCFSFARGDRAEAGRALRVFCASKSLPIAGRATPPATGSLRHGPLDALLGRARCQDPDPAQPGRSLIEPPPRPDALDPPAPPRRENQQRWAGPKTGRPAC